MVNASIAEFEIIKIGDQRSDNTMDYLAVEEPLEIRLHYGTFDRRLSKNISITMRTPGNDVELAKGFLFTEGIISSKTDVAGVSPNAFDENIIEVSLNENVSIDLKKIERHFYTSSSCGVCGKSSIDSVRTVVPMTNDSGNLKVNTPTLLQLPSTLRAQQDVFEYTGGLHASALFDASGNLIMMREDVGRHNALDKLIGTALEQDLIPVSNHILLLSGRASFELIQKAAMAGIKIVAAVGAPSSLAVNLAKDFKMTLVGFLRDERFNIYNGIERIVVN